MNDSITGAGGLTCENAGLTKDNKVIKWHIIDGKNEQELKLCESRSAAKEVAEFIRIKAKCFGYHIYQFFWTKNTLRYAMEVQVKLSNMNGVSEVRLLETSESGVKMQRNVNNKLRSVLNDARREGVGQSYSPREINEFEKGRELWNVVMHTFKEIADKAHNDKLVDRIGRLKDELYDYQARVSTDYARKVTKRTFLVRFKRHGEGLGEYSQAEDDMLAQNGFCHHLFVAIDEPKII